MILCSQKRVAKAKPKDHAWGSPRDLHIKCFFSSSDLLPKLAEDVGKIKYYGEHVLIRNIGDREELLQLAGEKKRKNW